LWCKEEEEEEEEDVVDIPRGRPSFSKTGKVSFFSNVFCIVESASKAEAIKKA